MTYEQAQFIFQKSYYSGRNYGKTEEPRFPFGYLYRGEIFTGGLVQLQHLTAKVSDEPLVARYKSCVESLPAIFTSMGRKLSDGSFCRYQGSELKIMDGNHRTQAHKNVGLLAIFAIMPESHWREYFDSTN